MMGVYALFPNWIVVCTYFISAVISGFFALRYVALMKATHGQILLFSIFYKRSSIITNIMQQREEIIHLLNEAKTEFIQQQNNISME